MGGTHLEKPPNGGDTFTEIGLRGTHFEGPANGGTYLRDQLTVGHT